MTETTILVARHVVLARAGEARAHLCDKAWHDHGVDVRMGEEETMHDVGAGEAELHRRIRRNADAPWHEAILYANESHRDRTVRLARRPEIALGELAPEMERLRVDRLDVAGRV